MWFKNLFILVCLFGGTIVLLRSCFVIITVSGDSMYPTLESGDRLLAKRVWRHSRLRVGQIVIGSMNKLTDSSDVSALFQLPDELHDHTLDEFLIDGSLDESENDILPFEPEPAKFIKRLVGLPHDKVEVEFSTLHEVMQKILLLTYKNNEPLKWTIPDAHCFIRGDGLVSADSLVWGPIPLDAIDGVFIAKLSRSNKSTDRNDDMPSDDMPSPFQRPESQRQLVNAVLGAPTRQECSS